ncbi:MAG: MATE family efflux transporter [Oscillospiraceae bacterium]|jgi:putative MATE family efflux protein|nr:MATE family efflux transporter [Oscillospiraceae bacterium]
MLVKDKAFYKSVAAITLPIAAQNLIGFGISMADVVMLGMADQSGDLLAACNLAGQPFFILTLFAFGLSGGGAAMAAQYWGKKDIDSIKRIISLIMRITLVVSAVFTLAAAIIPTQILMLFTNNPNIIEPGAQYLRVLSPVYLIASLSIALVCSLRSVELVKIAVLTDLTSLVINIVLNWLLIFGNLGFPKLGIVGAGIATDIARVFEICILCFYVFVYDKRLKLRLRDLKIWDKELFSDLLRIGSPVVINELMWAIGMSMLAAILGHITYGEGNPVAASSMANTVQQLMLVISFGIANAAAIITGKTIGEGNVHKVKSQAQTFVLLSSAAGIAFGLLVFFGRGIAVTAFGIGADTAELARQFMIVTSVNVFFASLSSMFIVGVFRGAGDTKFCLKAEIGALWGLSVPAAFLAAFIFKAPLVLVFACMRLDEVMKTIICFFRLGGNKWVNITTRDRLETTAEPVLESGD